jgi:hypothetical protein
MPNFAEDLEMDARREFDAEMEAHRAAYQFGRSVQRCEDRREQVWADVWLSRLLIALSGFIVGLAAASILNFIAFHLKGYL